MLEFILIVTRQHNMAEICNNNLVIGIFNAIFGLKLAFSLKSFVLLYFEMMFFSFKGCF